MAGDGDNLRLVIFDNFAPARQHARGEISEALAARRAEIDDVAPARGPIADAPATITPAVAGAWQWADNATLTFTPADDLPKATAFLFALVLVMPWMLMRLISYTVELFGNFARYAQ